MDETANLSHICLQQHNDQTVSTDSTVHDIFLVVQDESNRERLRIVQLDDEGGEVTSFGEMPYLCCPSVVACASSIFCLGDWSCSGLVYQFDLVTRTAQTATQLEEPVRSIASAASGHEVIVSGGRKKNGQVVATCSVFAPATNRQGFVLTLVRNVALLLQFHWLTASSSSFSRKLPLSRHFDSFHSPFSWTSLRPLRQVRFGHRMCWLSDGRVFAIGGFGLSSVEMLERAWIPAPREEASVEWRNMAPIKTGRFGFGCCVVEGRIVVAGGWTVESFEPPIPKNIGQWTSLTDLASTVSWGFLVPSAAGLLLIDWNGERQLGRQKAQAASSSEWTWEPRPRLTSFEYCLGLVSLPSTAGASQR